MSLAPQTRELLAYLGKNPMLRAQIAAGRDSTILYAGRLMQPAWMEIAEMKKSMPQLATKTTLPEVLETIGTPAGPFPNLLEWAKSLDALTPWEHNGFIGWRALSGIFASNARGAVSFVIGSGITRDLLEYDQSCIKSGRTDLNVSFIAG